VSYNCAKNNVAAVSVNVLISVIASCCKTPSYAGRKTFFIPRLIVTI